VAWLRGTPAGYGQIEAQPGGQVEISCLGLLPSFIGRGIGGHLLAEVLQRAWSLADRWPDREPTQRVWVHTCSLDGKAALPNYKARGMRPYDTKTESVELAETPPGPWPGARKAP
jgi:GNAT superfamily N-acetyltransferase